MTLGVVGGSLGGLIAAHALRRSGYEVQVYERSQGKIKLRGAGMGLQGPLADYLRANDIADPGAIATQARTRRIYDARGTLLDEQRFVQLTTSWEALWTAFRHVTPSESIHEGYALQSFEQVDDAVLLKFENGQERMVDFMVAADGVHSLTRLKLLGRKPTYAGYVAWRGIVEEADAPAGAIDMLNDASAFCQIPQSLFLAYLIPGADSAVEPGRRYLNWVWYKRVEEGADLTYHLTDKNSLLHEFSIPEGSLRDDLRSAFLGTAAQELPKAFARIVEATANPFLQPIIDFDLDQMAFGRVALVGDAAFVIRPHTAASTYKAAIDGIELAQCFASGKQLEAATEEWQRRQLAFGKRLLVSGQASGNNIMGFHQ